MTRRNAYAAPHWAASQRVGDVGTKAVLLVLANYADEEFSCYPAQATIAEETEQSVRTVRRQLARLEELGLIRREHRYDGRGKRTSDRFYLDLDATAAEPLADNLTASDPADADDLAATGDPKSDEPLPDTPGRTTGHQRSPLPDTGGRVTPRELPENTGSLRSPGADVVPMRPSGQPSTSAQRRNGTRLPADWQPGPAEVAWARQQGFPDAWSIAQTEQFRDYWTAIPGARGRKLDWPATWRNWLRKSAERGSPAARPGRVATTDQRVLDAMALADRFAREEESR
ncbi:MAG TPA: helix-turn-helix domain-containing protein [Spirillospora sp.]|nr:helix-turn-helix domain-containing protein [Spirillospora sp.]